GPPPQQPPHAQQPPVGAAGAAGAPASYQYGASGHLDQPADSPYDTGFLRSGAHGGGQGDAGAPGQPGGYQGAPQGGYPGGPQGGYPGGPQGGYPGGAQGGPGETKKSNTGIIIGAIAAAVVVLGLLIWGGIALFGGSDDEIVTEPDPVT